MKKDSDVSHVAYYIPMRPIMYIKLGELRNIVVRMRTLVDKTLGVKEVNSRASFNDELGVIGLDWDSFLDEYNKEFGIQLDGLDYSKYFDEETLLLSDILLLPYRLGRLLILTLIGRRDMIPRKKPLTVGDLIVSVHAGRFVERGETDIRLVKCQGGNQ